MLTRIALAAVLAALLLLGAASWLGEANAQSYHPKVEPARVETGDCWRAHAGSWVHIVVATHLTRAGYGQPLVRGAVAAGVWKGGRHVRLPMKATVTHGRAAAKVPYKATTLRYARTRWLVPGAALGPTRAWVRVDWPGRGSTVYGCRTRA